MKEAKSGSFREGVRDAVPIMLGYVPIGIAYAIIARQGGMSTVETVLMSLLVYAGASQIMAAGMLAQGAAAPVIVLATFLLNLRHLIMSLCVNNRLRGASLGGRMLGSGLVTDESFAVFTTAAPEKCNIRYYLGMALGAYGAWAASSLVGSFVTDLLPAILSASLGIALYAMFIALLLPHLHGNARLGLLVLLTALCNWGLGKLMAASWALIVSTLLCAFLGLFFVDLGEEARDA
ncbi:MAG: AzlC family ABC transporter permease [Eubacteriales bacterium]|nr:AzlC family ABC transporter permease [Eubacteriales bacterium]